MRVFEDVGCRETREQASQAGQEGRSADSNPDF